MASLHQGSVSIAKLNGSNYQVWKFKVKMLLIKDDLWQIVEKEKPANAAETPQDWDKLNGKAMATISLLIEDDQLIHVSDHDTARGMWFSLQKLHERANLSNKMYLLRKLYTLKLGNNSMQGHISALMEIVALLRGIGSQVPEDHLAAILMCSLPESYRNLVNALEARPDTELTLELVRGKLIDEENRRKERTLNSCFANDETETAQKASHVKSNKDLKGVACFFCKKKGHYKRDCYSFKRLEAQEKQRSKQVVFSDACDENMHDHKTYSAFKSSQKLSRHQWCVDSGASSHMTSDRTFFTELRPLKEKIFLADDSMVMTEGIGEGWLKCMKPDGHIEDVIVNDVLYVPNLDSGLISVSKLTARGYMVKFTGDKCLISNNDRVIAQAQLKNNLYILQFKEEESALCARHDNCVHLWHRRLGHRDPAAIKKLVTEEMAEGIKLKNCGKLMDCVCCIKGKLAKKPFKASESRAIAPLDLIHSDVCGPMPTTTPSGNRYVATFIDDYSRYAHVYLLKRKSDVVGKLKEFVAETSNKFQRKPSIFRTDNGKEYVNNEMLSYFKKKGIVHQYTVPYTPEQNAIAERKNRTLTEMAKCMLIDSKLHDRYWGEAVVTAAYLQNRLPSRSVELTPYELWHGTKPQLGHIKVFGAKAYSFVPKQKRKKFDDKAREGVLIGYGATTKGYRILDPKTANIWISRTVRFDEGQGENVLECSKVNIKEPTKETHPVDTSTQTEPRISQIADIQNEIDIDMTDEIEELEPTDPRRSPRTNKGIPPCRLSYLARSEHIQEPATWKDVMNLAPREKKMWVEAAEEEIASLRKHKTWELTMLPSNRKAIGCKWVFKTKFDSNTQTHKCKARLVAKGFSQKFGVDYDETFAPVVKHETVRVLFSLAAAKKLQVHHFDVKTAFLHGDIEEELYMEQPPGFVAQDEENKVCKLKHSIYGLKQSARVWNQKVNKALLDEGFTQSKADSCLYARQDLKNNKWTYVLLYVDDLLVASEKGKEISNILQKLNIYFETKDLGKASYYLGIQIEREDDGSYFLHQATKIQHMLEKYGMADAKPVNTPMEADYPKLSGDDDKLPNNNQYRQIIGSLLYIATVSRPDIATAVGMLSRRVAQPRERDWTAAKRVLRYLKGTIDSKLYLPATSNPELIGYVDADWAGDSSDRKSTSGYLFQLGGGTISWSSRKQTIVALSSTEAEYVAAAHACQEVMWLRQLLEDMGLPMDKATKLFEDNQGCIKLTQSGRTSARTKHIDVKYHMLRDLQEQGTIHIEYCPSEKQAADMFTKPLNKELLQRHMKTVNISVRSTSRREGVLEY